MKINLIFQEEKTKLIKKITHLINEKEPQKEPQIILSKEETSHSWFCFLGEFGYEMVSWVPFLLFLKEKVGVKMRTIGRPGSSIFYYFSDEHIELDASFVGHVWGDPLLYAKVAKMFHNDILIYPGKKCVNEKKIIIAGHAWLNKNIHRRIIEKNYLKPDYSFVSPLSIIPNKQIVTINNKYMRQWPDIYEYPVNYFDQDALLKLKKILTDKGYGVVYNHYIEKTSADEYPEFDDLDIFGNDSNTYDMRKLYEKCANIRERNKKQLELYNSSTFVIAPQGGNIYLPTICRCPIFVLMRAGDYIDYLELGRLYNVNIEMFYEPKHLVSWLEKVIPNVQ